MVEDNRIIPIYIFPNKEKYQIKI